MTRDASRRGRRRAGVLLIITSVLWLHQWFPALMVVGFVVWLVIHRRLEGDLGDRLLRLWQRRWPLPAMVLVPLLIGGAVAYAIADQPLRTKLVPIALNLLGLSMVVFGNWGRLFTPALDAGHPLSSGPLRRSSRAA